HLRRDSRYALLPLTNSLCAFDDAVDVFLGHGYIRNSAPKSTRRRAVAVMRAASGWTALIRKILSSLTRTEGSSQTASAPAWYQSEPNCCETMLFGIASQPPGRDASGKIFRLSQTESGISISMTYRFMGTASPRCAPVSSMAKAIDSAA